MMKEMQALLDRARAHQIAIERSDRNGHQAHVSITPMGSVDKAKVYSFRTCVGHCQKCDAIWIEMRMLLRSTGVKMVHIGARKSTTPTQAVDLSD